MSSMVRISMEGGAHYLFILLLVGGFDGLANCRQFGIHIHFKGNWIMTTVKLVNWSSTSKLEFLQNSKIQSTSVIRMIRKTGWFCGCQEDDVDIANEFVNYCTIGIRVDRIPGYGI
ncbi:hypothetical protein AVEN_106734-1 [Araneus ventricosus]|uniref:Uncharacterized protein n=1 Tax=Araneus ventricosus TaxID=182803 RepID=A0A4Y2NRU9_ARAVE|nr:hypothetical protein AVEN_106734-1 [Araneus ventricosus]